MKRIDRFFCILFLLLTLCSCASNDLYHWGKYEDHVCDNLDEEKNQSPQEQLEVVELEIKKSQKEGKPLPPGFYAHLAYLKHLCGDNAGAIQCLETEKNNFPESTPFVERLINNLNRTNKTKTL